MSDRLRDIAAFFLRLIKSRPERVIILGDVFDKRRLDAVTLKVGTRLLLKLAEVCPVYIVPGNHDTEDAAGNHNTVQYLTALGASRLFVMQRGEVVHLDGIAFHAFPYLTPGRFGEMVEKQELVDGKRNVALFHQAVEGSMQGGTPFPSRIPPSLFKRFDLALGGHVHHRQTIGNVVFVGSTYNVDFREANEAQGYHKLNTTTLDLEFVPSEMPRFRVHDGTLDEFKRDDYVMVKNSEAVPVLDERPRVLICKPPDEAATERTRLDIDADRFTWNDAIVEYVKLKEADESRRPTLIELGKKLVGASKSRPGCVPGLVEFVAVEASDFLCFKSLPMLRLDKPGATLVIGRNRDTAAATSNGAGKTTIFRAMTWALYGALIEKGSDVIRHGAKKAAVKLTFTKGGDMYVVERSRTKSRSSLKLTMNGKNISAEGSQKGTQAMIERLLGLDFLSFRNSVLFGQGDRMRFAAPELKDEDRKKIFRAALDIDDVIKVAQRDASAARSRHSAKLAEATRKVDECGVWIKRLEGEVADLERRWSEAETAKAERIKEAETERADLPDLASLTRRLKALTEQRAEMLGEAIGIKEHSDTIAECDRAIAELDKKIRTEDREEAAIATRLKIESDKLVQFKDGACPTCGTTRHTSSAFDNHLGMIEEEIEALKVEQSEIREDIAKLDGAKQEHAERRAQANTDLQEALKNKRNADAMGASIAGLESKVEHLDRERTRIDEDIRTIKGIPNPYTEQRTASRADLVSRRAELGKAEKARAKAARAEGLLDFWVRGFGNKGIASFLVELYLPRLQSHANEYLGILSDGDIKLDLSATTTTHKGTEAETLSVRYDIEGVVDALPSGGQLKKIEIAVDLAFMDILAERDGAEIGFIILDEILDGLDSEGRSRVMTLIDVLRRRKGAAFVISHDAELSAAFDDVLLVVRKGGTSHVIDA
jgi:DNA repair exonuclease SbcCD ATPase subunit/predicted phosphodiesterase